HRQILRNPIINVPFAAIRPRGFMGKKNDGGFAFPMEATDATAWKDCNQGMTLRDYFAAKAMAAIVRRWDGHSFGGGPNSPQYKELAEDAYYIADAMLRAREES
ncbi:TPA: hypothetical protein ACQJX9_005372, partial [Citrobacter farmeri]